MITSGAAGAAKQRLEEEEEGGIWKIFPVPVDGNISGGLKQVRGAAIGGKWLIIRNCCIMHAKMLSGWLEDSHSAKPI